MRPVLEAGQTPSLFQSNEHNPYCHKANKVDEAAEPETAQALPETKAMSAGDGSAHDDAGKNHTDGDSRLGIHEVPKRHEPIGGKCAVIGQKREDGCQPKQEGYTAKLPCAVPVKEVAKGVRRVETTHSEFLSIFVNGSATRAIA